MAFYTTSVSWLRHVYATMQLETLNLLHTWPRNQYVKLLPLAEWYHEGRLHVQGLIREQWAREGLRPRVREVANPPLDDRVNFSFLRASAMLKHVLAIGWTSVRLSVRLFVCPSVTRWYCIKTAEYIVMLSSPHDSPFILVLCISRSSRNSDGVTLCGAAKHVAIFDQ